MDNFTEISEHYIKTSHGMIAVKLRLGTGPALILLHGNSFSNAVFSSYFTNPAFAGMTLVAPDLPGHGKSENAPASTYNYSGFADCIGELAVALKLDTYVVFGWSLGGQIAIEMLDRAPGLLGVATYGSAVVQRGPLGMLNGFHFTRSLLLASKAVMTEVEAQKFAAMCCDGKSDAKVVQSILRIDPALRPALSRAALFGKDRDQRTIIAETQTPVCLMLGENDPFISQDTFGRVSGQSLFGGKPRLARNCGHAPFGKAAEKVIPAIVHFYQHAVVYERLPAAIPLRLAS